MDESFVDVESLDCAIKAELKHDGIIYIYIHIVYQYIHDHHEITCMNHS